MRDIREKIKRAADLVIRLVLPTLWSPRRTIFVRLRVPEETAVVGVVGVAMIVSASNYRYNAQAKKKMQERKR